jgi:hypothetical protein
MRVPHVLVPLVVAASAACGSPSGMMPKLSDTASRIASFFQQL